MKILSKLMLLALPVALAACGGGGGQTCATNYQLLKKECVPTTTHTPPEGIWAGASAAATSVLTLVLENGQYYSLYSSSGTFVALVQGTMTATNNAFSDPAAVAFVGSTTAEASDLEGTFVAQSSITGTAGSLTFNGSYNSVYGTALNVSDVVGTWTDALASGTSSLTVASDGSFSGTAEGCAISGTMTPRTTGKHVLDGTVLLQNSGSTTCQYGNGTTLSFEATDINGELIALGVTAQRTLPFVMTLVR
ncbi:hypothetical protein [Paraburkholderia phosphatilytica]|uniref:hypothetical protein n=1 Tax=Paraburkholderia phosphatilytica TaxID=2282883 RepID=UPI000E4722B4|nr:hypothetical protein [Paraburkholderia phosphatilytica]